MTNAAPDAAGASPVLKDLVIAVNGVYFDQMRAGVKLEEFRERTPYWTQRLVGRKYERVIITRGYPKADDSSRRLVFPWRGFVPKTIQHPHFGLEPVDVFAIAVRP